MIPKEIRISCFTSIAWFAWLLAFVSVSGYDGLYGQDSNEYYRYYLRITSYFRMGMPPGDFFWPVHYPLTGALLHTVTSFDDSLQMVSLFSAAALLGLLGYFLMRQFPGREKEVLYYVIVLMGFSPFFFRYAISCMSDTMAMTLSCGTFYLAWSHLKTGSRFSFHAALLCAGVAVFTRYAMFPLQLPVVAYLLFRGMKNLKLVDYAVAILILLLPLWIHWHFKQDQSTAILQHSLLGEWSVANYVKRIFLIEEGRLGYPLPNIVAVLTFVVHPGLVFPGLLFLIVWITDRKHKPDLAFPVMVSGMACYILFVAGLNFQNERYLVPLVPFYLVMCFPLYLKIISRFYTRKGVLLTMGSALVVIQLLLVYRAFIPFFRMNQTEKQLAAAVKRHNPAVLYTFGVEGALENRGYQGMIVGLHKAPLRSVNPNAFLLFNRKQMEAQWDGKNPMNNYWFLMKQGNPRWMESPGTGWELYELTKAYPDPDPGIPGE
jgi:hypothetical protein